MYTISWTDYDTSGFSSDATIITQTGRISSQTNPWQISRHQTTSVSAHMEHWRVDLILLHLLSGMVEDLKNRHHSPAGDSLAFFK